jgi:excisionase family DNA binding protein
MQAAIADWGLQIPDFRFPDFSPPPLGNLLIVDCNYRTMHQDDLPLSFESERFLIAPLNGTLPSAEREDITVCLSRNSRMAKGKNVLTTGDVARICNVAPRTVSKWFDSGQLKGYRIPGSKDRRIPLGELLRFMKANNIPTESLAVGKMRILLVDGQDGSLTALAESLAIQANYDVQIAHTAFQAGAVFQRFSPHVVLINLLATDVDAHGLCRSIRASEEFGTAKIIALANPLSSQEAAALMQRGFDAYVANPTDLGEVAQKIEDATAIIY